MITTCTHCHRAYWRYRRDHPPSGFCSLPCHDIHMDRPGKIRHSKDGPGIPAAIIEMIKSHNRIKHRPRVDEDGDWIDCRECERLEALLAEAIAWHSPPRPEDMANGAAA